MTVTGTVAATSYTGDGSQLTGIGAGSTANIITNNLQVLNDIYIYWNSDI